MRIGQIQKETDLLRKAKLLFTLVLDNGDKDDVVIRNVGEVDFLPFSSICDNLR